MSVSVGIFQNEEAVLEGVRLLGEAGIDSSDIRIIVDNRENTPLISSNATVPIEELSAIKETRINRGGGIIGAPAAAAFSMNNGMNQAGSGGGIVFTGLTGDDTPDTEEVLNDMGIPSSVADQCEEAVEAGLYLLVTEAAPDPRVGSILRSAGAVEVVT